jgi:8-oxo-dGTP diphosphatase
LKPIFGRPVKNKDYQIRKSAYVIIFNSKKDRLLTVHNGMGEYFLPGGGLEENENDEACIERELLEETGFGVIVGSFIGSAEYYFVSRNNEHLLSDATFYYAEIRTNVQEPYEVDHHTEWLHIHDMEKLFVFEHQIWAVMKALEQ